MEFFIQTLDAYERSAIADVLEAEYIKAGASIVIEGTPGDRFYFLEEVLKSKEIQKIFYMDLINFFT